MTATILVDASAIKKQTFGPTEDCPTSVPSVCELATQRGDCIRPWQIGVCQPLVGDRWGEWVDKAHDAVRENVFLTMRNTPCQGSGTFDMNLHFAYVSQMFQNPDGCRRQRRVILSVASPGHIADILSASTSEDLMFEIIHPFYQTDERRRSRHDCNDWMRRQEMQKSVYHRIMVAKQYKSDLMNHRIKCPNSLGSHRVGETMMFLEYLDDALPGIVTDPPHQLKVELADPNKTVEEIEEIVKYMPAHQRWRGIEYLREQVEHFALFQLEDPGFENRLLLQQQLAREPYNR